MKDLQSAAALITGGGTGIGKATAIALASAGVRSLVISYASSKHEAEATAHQLESLGAKVVPVQADVRSSSDIDALFSTAEDAFGRLDILVNNAGTTRYVTLNDLDG